MRDSFKRDIKFRAWNRKKEQMCDVLLICFVNEYVTVLPEENLEGGNQEEWKFEDIDLMISSGLKDSYGKEVFEGDLIKHKQWIDGAASEICIDRINYYKGGLFNNDELSLMWIIEESTIKTKVVGNIYETPELLSQ